ncbi:hypothetical protein F4678DRAFT_478128 [Xylaria arbuscula]|nr:hypothetical protein F4678DRAFT_478128 [Xylaria arbuscula]
MSDTGSRTIPRLTVLDYGLTRRLLSAGGVDKQFMEPYVNGRADYICFGIGNGSNIFNSYLVSPELNSYITAFVELTETEEIGSKRRCLMRYRDMMVDNYLHAGGDLKTWRYIGASHIINKATRFVIEKTFFERGKNYRDGGSVEILPSDEDFTDTTLANPFTRGVQGLLRAYENEMDMAKIKRVIFVSGGTIAGLVDDEPDFNLLIELCRRGEEGYPADQAS